MIQPRVNLVSLSAPFPLPTDIMHSCFLDNPTSPLCHKKSDKHHYFVNSSPTLRRMTSLKNSPFIPPSPPETLL